MTSPNTTCGAFVPARHRYAVYGDLLATLLPTASLVALVRDDDIPLCTCKGNLAALLLRAARRALDCARGAPQSISGEAVARTVDGQAISTYVLRDAAGDAVCAVAICQASYFAERSVTQTLDLLRPVLDCLVRELNLRQRIEAARRASALPPVPAGFVEQEPGFLCNRADLARLVDAARAKLGCEATALIVPEHSLAVIARRPGAPANLASEYLTRSHRLLMHWALRQSRPFVLNVPDAMGRLPPCRFLSVRIEDSGRRAAGFLAFITGLGAPPFAAEHVQVASSLAARIEERLRTHYDAQTGLATRPAFEHDAERLLADGARAAPCALAYFDIAGMQRINERYGFAVGDAVIAEVGAALRRLAPADALASRLSGDRYALLLTGAGLAQAQELAGELAERTARATSTQGEHAVRVELSLGVAQVCAQSERGLRHALAGAEQASNVAKRLARTVPPPPLPDPVALPVGAQELRDWVAAGRFELHAQPAVALGAIAREPCYELLLRGVGARGEVLAPGGLITAAEDQGLMRAVDVWVVEQAFALLATGGAALQRPAVRFAINLSHQSLADETVPAAIESAWRRSGLPAQRVCFEVAESAVCADRARAVSTMQRLWSLGFEIALDRAGGGLLTPREIAELPVDVLKFGHDTVRRVATESLVAESLAALVEDARSRRRRTVASGIESDAQQYALARLGVDYGQGFAIGRPVPLCDVLRELGVPVDGAAAGAQPAGAPCGTLSASRPSESRGRSRLAALLGWR